MLKAMIINGLGFISAPLYLLGATLLVRRRVELTQVLEEVEA
ncbi:MAG: hypothetical protein HRU34_12905 [Richelia sp.]|nr:hypothetical protein [Richelia sp.]CDN10816.1 hypothetical protein RintRC_4125 [Richelia intracellularis]